MSRISADDQLKFLLCCVKHANNGKIDFTEVARECAVVSRSAACKRYDRLLKANGMTRNGISKTEPKSKKRNADAIAKAAEEKRRKIEGDHNDPAADDDDIKPVVPKLEPGTAPMIKSEPGSGYQAFPYSSTFMQAQNPYIPGYPPTSTTSSIPGYPLNRTTTANEPFTCMPLPWQNSSPIFPRTTSPPPSIRQELPNQDSASSSPTMPALYIKKESTMEQTAVHPAPQISHSEQARQQAAMLQPQQDAVFQDFRNSTLFMPPLQQKRVVPPSPSARPPGESWSKRIEGPHRTAVSTNPITDNLSQVDRGPDQLECIIIDD